MGEPGLPPLAPAFANAVARLTGKPLRRLTAAPRMAAIEPSKPGRGCRTADRLREGSRDPKRPL